MLKDGRCVGVGLARKRDASQARSLDFRTQLSVWHNKALVVHCRGGGVSPRVGKGNYHERGGSNLKVYVHSFTGGGDTCEGWVQNFPRVVFAVGKLAAKEGLGRCALSGGGGRLHSPFMVREWVGWLCKVWNLPRRVVTMILERNVVRPPAGEEIKGKKGRMINI